MATNDEIKKELLRKSELISKVLSSGKDVELRKTKDGISVVELVKKVIK